MRWRSGFFRPASCSEPLKHWAFRSRHTRIGCTPGPSTMNLSPMEMAAADGRNLRIAADHGNSLELKPLLHDVSGFQ